MPANETVMPANAGIHDFLAGARRRGYPHSRAVTKCEGKRVPRDGHAAAQAELVEAPWELPDGWRWERLGSIFPLEYGRALPARSRTVVGDVPVIGSSGVVGHHEIGIGGRPGHCCRAEGLGWRGLLKSRPLFAH